MNYLIDRYFSTLTRKDNPNNMYRDPNDGITRAELVKQLNLRATNDNPPTFKGYRSIEEVVRASVDAVQPFPYDTTKRSTEPVLPDELITLAELDAAFKRHGYADFSTPHHVEKLWRDIKMHRENFKTNDIVQSSTGAVFSLQPSGRWLNYTDGNFLAYDKPGRPLTKIGTTA